MYFIKFILWQLVLPLYALRKEFELIRLIWQHERDENLSKAAEIIDCRFNTVTCRYFVDPRVSLFIRTLLDGLTEGRYHKTRTRAIIDNHLTRYKLYKQYRELLLTEDAYSLIELVWKFEDYRSDELANIYKFGLIDKIDKEFALAKLKPLDYSRLL